MAHFPVYLACAVGALGIFLLVRFQDVNYRILGVITGLAGLGWLLAQLALSGDAGEPRPAVLFWVFALIAVAAAARMITHSRPVYSALYFVMVVLSTSGLFLLLHAEFMALALVIVYAGAILITYLFVIMLAQQAPTGEDEAHRAGYDRIAREPAAAAIVGFLMIAVLSRAIFDREAQLPPPQTDAAIFAQAVEDINLLPAKRAAFIEALHERSIAVDLPTSAKLASIDWKTAVFVKDTATNETVMIDLTAADIDRDLLRTLVPLNIERVGLALVWKFPASLEVAGVILLMAMFGAVVLARKQIEMGEDEKREAAGMRRMSAEAIERETGGEA